MNETKLNFTNWLINKEYAFSTIDAYPYWLESRIAKKFKISDVDNLLDINNIEFLKTIEPKYMSRDLFKSEQDLRSALRKYIEFLIFEKQGNKNENFIENGSKLSFTEGGKKVVISKRSERNRKLRDEAIKIHGLNCQVCEFNFENYYGEIGIDFIEVHHIVPLSTNYKPKRTNPKTDLNVVCSNCHRMIHRKKNITLTIEEFKEKLRK